MDKAIDSRARLNNGVEMPWLGLGLWDAGRGKETRRAVRWALEAGYRHIDTASAYGNEQDVGAAVADSDIARQDVFITTKVWNSDHGYDKTIQACRKSLEIMGLDYVDLYLIHWPVAELRLETWRALVALREEGKCRAIGVSNYMIPHLEELLSASDVVPAVNQVEFHPFLYERDLLEFCRARGVQLEAYSPLTRGRKLRDERLAALAARYNRTPAQILIRWALEHDVAVIPKSVHEERIRQNADVFDFRISRQDMAALDALDEGHRSLPPAWNPHEWP
jgi:diketogulonate reductase-like aldo/keto reductase